MMYGFGSAMGAAGWIWMIFGVVAFVLIVWLVVQAAAPRREPQIDAAAEVLRGRLARGEITADEYEQTRRTLGLS